PVQAFTALPSTCTTQAPHWEVSQPTWVPVSRRFSRRNCTRRVRGSTSPVTALPFTVSATADMTLLLEIRPKTSFFAPTGETDGGSGQNRVDFAPGHGLEQVDSEPAAQGGSRGCGTGDLALLTWALLTWALPTWALPTWALPTWALARVVIPVASLPQRT